MHIIGTDPGTHGALAVIKENGLISLDDMPIIMPTKKVAAWEKKPKPIIDIQQLARLMKWLYSRARKANDNVLCVIENVGASPKMGATSAFTFGKAAAAVEVAAYALSEDGDSVIKVTPHKWKQFFGLTGKPKSASIRKAKELYPEVGNRVRLVKHDGRAEAILIAHYGYHVTFKSR